jgi:hypothetical protein
MMRDIGFLGNSMPVPMIRWLGKRIAAQIHTPVPETFELFGEVA